MASPSESLSIASLSVYGEYLVRRLEYSKNRLRTSVGVDFAVLWKFVKPNLFQRKPKLQGVNHLRKIHILVYTTNILRKMLSDGREFSAIYTYHAELVYLSTKVLEIYIYCFSESLLCLIFEDQNM